MTKTDVTGYRLRMRFNQWYIDFYNKLTLLYSEGPYDYVTATQEANDCGFPDMDKGVK